MARKRKSEPQPQPNNDVEEVEEEFEEVEVEEEVEEEEESEDNDEDESEGSEEEEEEEVEEVEEEEEEEEDVEEEEDEEKEEEPKREPKKPKIKEKGENFDENLDPLDREAIKKLLEPFGKDQLIDLLKEAALKNPSLLSRLATAADSDPAHRKIFVHGLGWDCTTEVLTAAFSGYGQIEECKVVSDRVSGRCKGYGFVLFKSRGAAQKALVEPQKKIGNRMTSCQLASAGPPGSQSGVPESTGRKIYVSNVGEHVNPERLRAFFAKFGEIEEGPLGYDRNTGKLRGFAIFVYKNVDGCRKALEEPKKMFEGCELNVQRAVEGLKQKNQPAGPSAGASAINVPAVMQASDATVAYAPQSYMGINPMVGLVGQSLNPVVGLLGQNAAVGLLNQGTATSGLPASLNGGSTTPPYGIGLGLAGGGAGINSISPTMIGNYASQVALQGLGAYQNIANPSSSNGMKSQLTPGSKGGYLGR